MTEPQDKTSTPKLVVSVLVQALWFALGLWALCYGRVNGSLLWLTVGVVSVIGAVWSLIWIAKTGRPTWW